MQQKNLLNSIHFKKKDNKLLKNKCYSKRQSCRDGIVTGRPRRFVQMKGLANVKWTGLLGHAVIIGYKKIDKLYERKIILCYLLFHI